MTEKEIDRLEKLKEIEKEIYKERSKIYLWYR